MPKTKGWMPEGNGVVHNPTSKITPLRAGHEIRAATLHICDGGYAGSVSWLVSAVSNPDSSATFVLDPATGEITQTASIYDATWANGLSWSVKEGCWIDPAKNRIARDDPRLWKGLIVGENPNLATVSIERAGKPKDPETPALRAATVRVLAYIARETGLVFVPGDTLIGHRDVGPIHRRNCPGPNANLAELAQLANAARGTPAREIGTYQSTIALTVYEVPEARPDRVALSGTARVPSQTPIRIDGWHGMFGHIAPDSPQLANVGFVDGSSLKLVPMPWSAKVAAPVYEAPSISGRRALGGAAAVQAGQTILIDSEHANRMAHIAPTSPVLANVGFIDLTQFERPAVADPVPVPVPLPQTPNPVSPQSLIIATSQSSEAQIAAFLIARRKTYAEVSIREIAHAYWTYASQAGVNALLAVAQMCHEADYTNSWWAMRPRRNPAGLGVTGRTVVGTPPNTVTWQRDDRQAGLWREGLRFASWDLSVRAHLGRLLAYALPAGAGTATQREFINLALGLRPLPASFRGAAPNLEGLEGRWAVPGDNYADAIARIALAILRS